MQLGKVARSHARSCRIAARQLMRTPHALLPALGVVATVVVVTGCANERTSTPASWSTTTRSYMFPPSKVQVAASPRVIEGPHAMPKGGGRFKLGTPYRIAGRWYVPREENDYDRSGLGSWYGDDFHGRKTANGEVFDKHALSAAHPTLPMPSYAWVTNLDNGRTVLVRINDRGPYSGGRIIDLSHATAHHLGFEHKGLTNVRVRYAGRAPLNGDDRRERQHLAAQPWFGGGRQAANAPYATGSVVRR